MIAQQDRKYALMVAASNGRMVQAEPRDVASIIDFCGEDCPVFPYAQAEVEVQR